jgi:hypothetical protein
MAIVRFNQFFVALLALSFLSAFVIPSGYTNPLRSIQKLFAPISWPARSIGASLRNRFAPEKHDDRAADDVKTENEHLRALVVSMTGTLEEMRRINADRDLVPDVVRSLSAPFRVIGSDPTSHRDSLSIGASGGDGVEAGMPVLYADGLVGRVARVSAGGAQIQLITDPGFRANARFFRYIKGADGKIVPAIVHTPQPDVRGAGNGWMRIVNIPLRDTAGQTPDEPERGVAVGDIVALDDPDWPRNLSRQMLGVVESIKPGAALYADIRVRPMRNLSALREVWVMNKSAM